MGRFEADNGVFRLSFTATLVAAALPACVSRFQTKLVPITPSQIWRADRHAAAPSPPPGTGKKPGASGCGPPGGDKQPLRPKAHLSIFQILTEFSTPGRPGT